MTFVDPGALYSVPSRQHGRDLRRTPQCCTQRARHLVLRVCNGPTCSLDGGSAALAATLRALAPNADIEMCGCLGGCGAGPNVLVRGRVASGARAALRVGQITMREETVNAMKLKQVADDELARGMQNKAAQSYSYALQALWDGAEPINVNELSARMRSNLSRALLEDGRIEEARIEARKALEEDPKLSAAWLRMAQAFWASGEELEAEGALRTASELDKGVTKRFEEWKSKRKKRAIWGRIFGK